VVAVSLKKKISQKIELTSMLKMGKGMSGRPQLPPSVTAAVLETIIAAIYLDGGIDPARDFILRHMVVFIEEAANSAHQHNFKSVLQHYAQKHMPSHPSYVILDEKGPDHSKAFEVCVEIDGRKFSGAWANSKKEAEQKAALLALTELGLATTDTHGLVHIRQPLEPVASDGSAREKTQGSADEAE